MKSVLILGAGNFGAMLARQMNTQGYEIMIVDVRENLINAVMPYVTDAQIGDCTNPTFLKSLGVDNYDLCVVSMCENFQTSLETTSLLKDLGAKQVISRAKNEIQERSLAARRPPPATRQQATGNRQQGTGETDCHGPPGLAMTGLRRSRPSSPGLRWWWKSTAKRAPWKRTSPP